MKILIIHYRYYITGGPERYLFNLKRALEDRGHQVIVFSRKLFQNEDNEYKDYWVDNIGKSNSIYYADTKKTIGTYCDMLFREFYSLKCKKAVKRLIRDTHPDICYLMVYKGVFSPSVINACKEMNLPVVNRISDYNPMCGACSLYRDGHFCKDCFRDNDWSCLKHRCVKNSFYLSTARYLSMRLHSWMRVNDKISAFVCTNGFMKQMLLERGLAKENKIHVIPTFFHETEKLTSVSKAFPDFENGLRLLYIGNIDESKGIYDLLNALKVLVKKHQNLHLDIVGGLHGEENSKMESFIKLWGLTNYITFQPFKHDGDVFDYYLNTHVTIIPARWSENLPNTLIESLYFHRPVIVPNSGSFQFTTDESVAFRYKSQSVDALIKILMDIVANPEKLRLKSDNCACFFQQHFSEEGHLNELINLFKRTIENEDI
jgi:glycosyltransferase involved in cell wall biosynthesis